MTLYARYDVKDNDNDDILLFCLSLFDVILAQFLKPCLATGVEQLMPFYAVINFTS